MRQKKTHGLEDAGLGSICLCVVGLRGMRVVCVRVVCGGVCVWGV